MQKIFGNKIKKRFVLTGIASALLLGACGNADASEDDHEAAANPDAETIVVGTGNAYQPFVYLDENGELDGYDVAVLKAVDEKLDQYNFEYESSDFKNILTSLFLFNNIIRNFFYLVIIFLIYIFQLFFLQI